MQELLKDVTGFYPQFYRAAHLGVNDLVYEVLVENDLVYCSREIGDAGLSVDPRTRSDEIMAQVADGDVILMHPTHDNYATLDILVPALRAAGYTFALPRLDDAPKTKSIGQHFGVWAGPFAEDVFLNNGSTIDEPRRDTAGTGYSWRAKVGSGDVYLRILGELRIKKPNSGLYFYTLFDRNGDSQPTEMIDMSGTHAALQLDMELAAAGTSLKVLIYDGTNWFLSNQTVDMSDSADNRNWLFFDSVTDWEQVTESADLVSNINTTTTLPELTTTSGGTPNLKRIQGVGLYVVADGSDIGVYDLVLHREFTPNLVDVTDRLANKVSRHLFGIAATAYQEDAGLDPNVQNYLSGWAEFMRLPGGSNMEHYNLKHAFNTDGAGVPDISAREWVAASRQNVNTNLDFIMGVSSVLGMDFEVPLNPGTNLNPTNIQHKLAGWYNHAEYAGGLPRGVDYATEVVSNLNLSYDQDWGVNPAATESARIKYLEVGNEIDLELGRYSTEHGLDLDHSLYMSNIITLFSANMLKPCMQWTPLLSFWVPPLPRLA
ncbi:hypothetical protein ACFLQY_01225 [Verrucomicrobiota bacterium]